MRLLGHLIDVAWLASGALAVTGAIWNYLSPSVCVTLGLVFFLGAWLWAPMRRVDSPAG